MKQYFFNGKIICETKKIQVKVLLDQWILRTVAVPAAGPVRLRLHHKTKQALAASSQHRHRIHFVIFMGNLYSFLHHKFFQVSFIIFSISFQESVVRNYCQKQLWSKQFRIRTEVSNISWSEESFTWKKNIFKQCEFFIDV